MKISSETIERIQQSADILEVVGDFVSLKKQGANWIACCPFHNEKTPSFAVSPAKGYYKCFGCGKAGDSITFVMDVESLGYVDALKYLAKKYNIEIEEREMTSAEEQEQTQREGLLIALTYAKNYYQQILFEHEDGQSIGLSYFRERGFSEKTIRDFELGYSLDSWDAFTKEALKKGYNIDILEKAGLTIQKEVEGRPENRQFDRFRARVIFPIHNVAGKVIAFGARILKTDKNQGGGHQPKYINSPETEVYHKSDVLYGIFQAKQAIRQEDVCYLAEGYTDVISLYQAGVSNVVASSGTSLTAGQIKIIGRFTQNITVLYDGDAAGLKASLRGTDMILEEGLNVSVVVFPDNEDPDSYVKRIGAEAFKQFIQQNKKDFITFKTELLLKGVGNDPFKRAEVTQEIVESISKIPDRNTREALTKKTSELLQVKEDTLIGMMNMVLKKRDAAGRQSTDKRSDQTKSDRRPTEHRPASTKPATTNQATNFEGISYPDPGTVDEEALAFELEQLRQEQEKPFGTLPPIYYQEKETIRLLLNYAQVEVEEGVMLWQYILAETEDIVFQTPVYHDIMEIYRKGAQVGKVPVTEFFIRHKNSPIQKEAITLIADKYELSEQWQSKFKIYVPIEVDKLSEMAYTNILRLKKCSVENLISENQQKLAKVTDEDEMMNLIDMQMRLKQVEMEIAKAFGNVTPR
ncbi:MAG: DNA primase [Bacteroidota bacterium]